MNPLRDFLDSATRAIARRVARKAQTSVPHLGHIAAGRRNASAGLARRIEIATAGTVPRESVCEACRQCEFLKAARAPT